MKKHIMTLQESRYQYTVDLMIPSFDIDYSVDIQFNEGKFKGMVVLDGGFKISPPYNFSLSSIYSGMDNIDFHKCIKIEPRMDVIGLLKKSKMPKETIKDFKPYTIGNNPFDTLAKVTWHAKVRVNIRITTKDNTYLIPGKGEFDPIYPKQRLVNMIAGDGSISHVNVQFIHDSINKKDNSFDLNEWDITKTDEDISISLYAKDDMINLYNALIINHNDLYPDGLADLKREFQV